MAEIILPQDGTKIYEFHENGETPVTTFLQFDYELANDETFVSFSITANPNPTSVGIQINNTNKTYSGKYENYFELIKNVPLPITLRNREPPHTIYTVNGFTQLPVDPTTADCILFEPPSQLSDDITITATLRYKKPPESGTGSDVEHTISGSVTQTVLGTYSAWGTLLKNYIQSSGPFPSVAKI